MVKSVLKWSAIVVPILFIMVYLAVGAVAANVLTVPKRQFTAQNNPGQFSLAYQEVQFPTRSGDVQIVSW
jgi:hypothetical protein